MSIRILLFASLAESAGEREMELDAPEPTDVRRLLSRLQERFPQLQTIGFAILCAVNSEYAHPGSPVKDGDEVAFFPPASGG
jgi:molybdopterin converting factor subunit 1